MANMANDKEQQFVKIRRLIVTIRDRAFKHWDEETGGVDDWLYVHTILSDVLALLPYDEQGKPVSPELVDKLRERMFELRNLMFIAPAANPDGRELLGDTFIHVIIQDVLEAYNLNHSPPSSGR